MYAFWLYMDDIKDVISGTVGRQTNSGEKNQQ